MAENSIRFFDMFAGVGGFRAGLERAGGFACIGHCEIDGHADRAYRAVHDIKPNEIFYEDARTINPKTMPEFDLLTGGFPCQSFSIAGKRRGFDDNRGTLFFEIARLAREKRPPYLLLENVPGLLSHDKGRTFTAILGTLSRLGYHVEFQVLNSKDFGVPQSRRRVYIVGYLNPRCAGKILPFRGTNPETLKLLISSRQDSRVYDPAGAGRTLLAGAGGPGGRTGLYAVGYNRNAGITKELKHAYTLTAGDFRGLNRSHTQNAALMVKPAHPGDSVDLSYAGRNTRRGRVGKDTAHTLNTGGSQGVVTPTLRIRRLTPRECFRLQGFSEGQIDRLLSVDSDTQAYKQAGNAVTVNVVHAIGLRLKTAHKAAVGATAAKKEKTAARIKTCPRNKHTPTIPTNHLPAQVPGTAKGQGGLEDKAAFL